MDFQFVFTSRMHFFLFVSHHSSVPMDTNHSSQLTIIEFITTVYFSSSLYTLQMSVVVSVCVLHTLTLACELNLIIIF